MKRLTILVAAAAILCVATPHPAQGQTEKTLQQFDGERTVEVPYVTYAEFENISIDGRGRMGELLTVRSVEQAVRILGEPKERDVTQFNGAYRKRVELLYDGLRISYIETALEAEEDVYLEGVKVTSPDHFLEIGATKVRPGMTQSKMAAPLQKELNQAKAEGTGDEPHTTIFIERKGKKKSKGERPTMEYTEIRIEQDPESGEVSLVRFSRVI